MLVHNGHIHDKGFVKDRMINVSVEMWDYKPVSMKTITDIITGQYEPTTIQMSVTPGWTGKFGRNSQLITH